MVLEQYLEEDGSLIIEIHLRITIDSKRVWYPKNVHEEKSLKESYMNPASSSPSNNQTCYRCYFRWRMVVRACRYD